MLIALAAGLLFLFPGLRRSEVELRCWLDAPRCVERLDFRIFSGDVLARSHSQLVNGRADLDARVKLKHGEYRAIVSLECSDGSQVIGSRQSIVVDGDGVIQFKASGEECRCSAQ